MNILVVDDKQDILTLVQAILEIDGYQVTTANNGNSAIDLCREQSFPLIFLDLMMEGKDGYDTLKEIRQISLNKDSYIIALTAKAYEGDKQEVIRQGFNDHFSKPFRATELLDKVQQSLSI
ncbi:MAG: response regulator [Candidatus Margulisiibacteriota bacterium]